jgi:hypothetical protein
VKVDRIHSLLFAIENFDQKIYEACMRRSGACSTQSSKKNGGDDETRTRDLCRDRAAF